MRFINNQKGIALVTSLMFTVITLVITMTLLYMVTAGSKTSGAMKRYRTATEAAYGGIDIMLKDIMSKSLIDATNPILTDSTFKTGMLSYLANMNSVSMSDCMRIKVMNPISKWSSACANNSLDANIGYDVKFNLNSATGTPFVVYSKIVDTMGHNLTVFENTSTATGMVMKQKTVLTAGNSDPSSLLLDGFSTTELEGGPGDKNPHYPYRYRIEVEAERAQNPSEKSKLSVMYVY